MKPKPVSVLVPLSALDENAVATIKDLTKKIRNLEQKLERRDKRIADLEGGMDLSKECRKKVRQLAINLADSLEEANWIDVNRYYEGEF